MREFTSKESSWFIIIITIFIIAKEWEKGLLRDPRRLKKFRGESRGNSCQVNSILSVK